MDPNVNLVGNLGYPPKAPKNTTPWTPEMAISMAPMIAHVDAQRLKKEAEMNTPEGRKKAAEKAEAELNEKRRAWGARAWALPFDGFIGIPDSAEDKELKVYTRTYDHKHKFWGIKPIGMSIWDFWDIYDPEVKRYYDANQETPANPEPLTAVPSPRKPPQRTKPAANVRRLQKNPETTSTHRVTKSTKSTTQKGENNTRKSLAHKILDGNMGLEDQMQVVKDTVRACGRPSRNKAAVTASAAEPKPANAKSRIQDATSSNPKRPRGRPPAKGKSTEKGPDQKKTPAVGGNARVTKSSRKEPRPSAPSTHKMRTRRAGPAELLQLL